MLALLSTVTLQRHAVGMPDNERAAVDLRRVRLSYQVAVRGHVDVVVDLCANQQVGARRVDGEGAATLIYALPSTSSRLSASVLPISLVISLASCCRFPAKAAHAFFTSSVLS